MPSLEDSLLLYAPFDGSVDADFARGDATGEAAIPPQFGEGLRGQALIIGGSPEGAGAVKDGLPDHQSMEKGRNVYFEPEGNFSLEQGTISFWVKPLNWGGSDPGFNVFFRTQQGHNHFMLYKFFHGERVLLLVGKQEEWTSSNHRAGHWQPGQWYHVAITWSPVEQRLFIDGVQVAREKRRFPLRGDEPVEPISVGPGGSWERGYIGESLIDEFRIHDRPLTQAEIAEIYALDASAALLDAGHVTIGPATPVADGQLEPFEYPFEATGFSDLRGVAAMQQSNYALGFDADHLYVAMRSDFAEDAQPADERVELFLSPVPGEEPLRHLVFTADGSVRIGAADSGGGSTAAIAVAQSFDDGQWTLEASIPYQALGTEPPQDGAVWRFNLGRVFGGEHATSVAPVVGSLADRAKFMELRFAAEMPALRIASMFDMANHTSVLDIAARAQNPGENVIFWGIRDDLDQPSYGLNMFQHPLFADGKSNPLQPPPPTSNQVHNMPPRALHERRITTTRDGQEALLLRSRYVVLDERLPMVTRFIGGRERANLLVSAEKRRDGAVRVRFLDPDQTEVWRAEQPIPAAADYFDAIFPLDFERLAPGLYEVKVDHVALDGTATETYSQAFRIPDADHPAFKPYQDPESDLVPAPWTPVRHSDATVAMWGREYDFSSGALFSRLTSQAHQILAAPAMLVLNGQPLEPIQPPEVATTAADDLEVAITKTADLGPIQLESRLTTHFDGYCDVEMTLLPGADGPAKIQTLALDIPLKAQYARMVRDAKISPINGSKSGAVVDAWSQKLVDAPFLWVGNDDAGFNWLAPSLENWHVRNHDRNVEILIEGDTATLRFHLVDTPLELDGPRTIRFGFALTPTRPLDPAVLRQRSGKEWAYWCQPWEYFGMFDYETARLEEIANKGRGVDEVFLYGGFGYMSPFHPDFLFFQDEWSSIRPERALGEFEGLLTVPRTCFTEGCLGSEGLRNFTYDMYARFFEQAKQPLTPQAIHYYFDSGVGVSRCFNPNHPDCGTWTGLDGKSYNRVLLDEYREWKLNTYRMIKRTGPQAKIADHQGWPRVMPLMNFAEILVGGEGVSADVGPKGNYYDFFTPELFRATFGNHIWGCRMVHLDMIVRLLTEHSPESIQNFRIDDPKVREPLLHSYGYCLVHDVDVWDGYAQSLPIRETIWAAQDALGWDPEVVFHPYWEADGPVRLLAPASDRILASAYSRHGRLILAVLNDTPEEQTVRIGLDLEALGVEAGAHGFDGFEPSSRYILDEIWEDRIPPRGLRMIVWAENASPDQWPDNGSRPAAQAAAEQ